MIGFIKKTTTVISINVVVALLGITVGSTTNAQDIERGKQIAGSSCVGCHGSDGNSPSPSFPKLAGQHAGYLLKQLSDYQSDKHGKIKRKSDIMMGMVSSLSDDDKKSVAAFYATQKLIPAVATNKDSEKLAQKLYRGGDRKRAIPPCSGCHGPSGAGIPSQYPLLAGQYAAYTKWSLLAYRNGTRNNDTDGVMQKISQYLTDAEIDALSDYIAGLRYSK